MENTSVIIAVSGLSFLMTVIWGDPLIRLLKVWRIGKIVREDGPDQHFVKWAHRRWAGSCSCSRSPC